jgi:hypothetical protein
MPNSSSKASLLLIRFKKDAAAIAYAEIVTIIKV